MKHYFFLIYLLSFSFTCSAYPQIKPKRGYPAIAPYAKTELSVASIHSPTLENTPTPLLEMPRVGEVDVDLPHTNAGDEIYDVTKWFPLDEMRGADEKAADDERWVYYNKTSGYVITYADHFLQASVYDYIDGSLTQDGYRVRLDMIYVATGDKVELNLESIQKAPHDVIFRVSSVVRLLERMTQRQGNKYLETEIEHANGRKAFFLMLDYFVDGYGTVSNAELCFPVSEWVIFECGISEAGKRKVMMVKADYVDLTGQVLHLEASRADFIKSQFPGSNDDPFGENDIEYYRLHPVPPDIVSLLSDSEQGTDGNPFGITDNADLTDVEITKLVRNQGVKAKAYAIPDAGCVLAYATEREHGNLEELFAALDGGDIPLALKYDLKFYEIDAPSDPNKKSWDEVDLLATHPEKLASVGMIAMSGLRVDHYSGESECEIELMRGEWTGKAGDFINYNLKFKMDLPLLKLDKEFEGVIRTGIPKVISLGINPKTNRRIMMLMRCREIVDRSTRN